MRWPELVIGEDWVGWSQMSSSTYQRFPTREIGVKVRVRVKKQGSKPTQEFLVPFGGAR